MEKMEFNTKIWEYYLILESQFVNTFKYIEPGSIHGSKNINKFTFSKIYNQLLLSVGSEVDILLKELCKINGDYTADEMSKYRENLKDYENFSNEGCKFIYDNEIIYPWTNFNEDKSPDWWIDYNSLKHDRLKDENFKLGNYNNVTQALAGLFIICRVLYREYFKYEPSNKSNIFKMYNWPEYAFFDDEVVLYSDNINNDNK